MPGNYLNNYGDLFLNYLPYQSLAYKLLWFTEGSIMLNRIEWKDNIDIIVNPTDERYSSFFTQKWNRQMVEELFPKRKLEDELVKLFKSSFYLVKQKALWHLFHHELPIEIKEYMINKKLS